MALPPEPQPTPSPTLAEATATLTAPGQRLRDGDADHPGVPTRTWKSAPGHPSIGARALLPPRGQDLPRLRGRAGLLRRALPHRRRAGPHPDRPLRHRQGDRVAIAMRNLPEWVMAFWASIAAGAVVRAPQRLVDRAPSWPTAWATLGPPWPSPTRSAGTDPPPSGEIPDLRAMVVVSEEPDPAAAAGGRELRGRATGRGAGADHPVHRAGRGPTRRGHPARSGHRPRGRRHHLLHLGHHRVAQGCRRDPPQQASPT